MNRSCEACRADAPVLEDNEIQELLSQIPSWKVFEEGDIKKIICSFIFLDYSDSRNFLNIRYRKIDFGCLEWFRTIPGTK